METQLKEEQEKLSNIVSYKGCFVENRNLTFMVIS
jgi:hypothetical protein